MVTAIRKMENQQRQPWCAIIIYWWRAFNFCYYGKIWILICKYSVNYSHHQVRNMNDKMVNLEHVRKPNDKNHEKWTRPVVVYRFIFSQKIEYTVFSKSLEYWTFNIQHNSFSMQNSLMYKCIFIPFHFMWNSFDISVIRFILQPNILWLCFIHSFN